MAAHAEIKETHDLQFDQQNLDDRINKKLLSKSITN